MPFISYFLFFTATNYPWNQFTNIKRIGFGKCGTVYKVTAKLDEREYALKQTHVPPNEKDFERCKKEIMAISNLNSPYIIRYFNSFVDKDGKVCIITELCGNDLNNCLKDRDLTIDVIRPQTVTILDQLLHGIDYIHSQKLIHRDLKPSNIFVVIVEDQVKVKIGDFGLASFEDDEMTSMTGAHLYRAPEQESNEYDCKVDIYTLGIVLFEVRKKKFEIKSEAWTKCIKNLRRKTKVTLKEFEPYQPKEWKQLLASFLAEDPDERPTAKYVLDAFMPRLKGTAEVAIMTPAEVPNPIPSISPISAPTGIPSPTPIMSGMFVSVFLFWAVNKLLYQKAGKINFQCFLLHIKLNKIQPSQRLWFSDTSTLLFWRVRCNTLVSNASPFKDHTAANICDENMQFFLCDRSGMGP